MKVVKTNAQPRLITLKKAGEVELLAIVAWDDIDTMEIDLDDFYGWYKSLPVYKTEGGYIHASNIPTVIDEFIIQQMECNYDK